MLSSELNDSFAAYLRQSMSQGLGDKLKAFEEGVKDHGLFSHIISRTLIDSSAIARELLFNQKQLLEVAERYLCEKPWIAYFAATKHIFFVRSRGITSSSFKEFRDKEYADGIDRYAETIALASEKNLDFDTQEFLHELITLQQVEPLIDQAVTGLEMLRDIPTEERRVFLHPEADDRSLMRKLWGDGGRDGRKLTFKMSTWATAAAADALKQSLETWISSPVETIGYLKELKRRRPILEETYLRP